MLLFQCFMVEFGSNKIGHLAGAISKWMIEGTSWLLLTVYSKMQEVKDFHVYHGIVKQEKEEGLRELENSPPTNVFSFI